MLINWPSQSHLQSLYPLNTHNNLHYVISVKDRVYLITKTDASNDLCPSNKGFATSCNLPSTSDLGMFAEGCRRLLVGQGLFGNLLIYLVSDQKYVN